MDHSAHPVIAPARRPRWAGLPHLGAAALAATGLIVSAPAAHAAPATTGTATATTAARTACVRQAMAAAVAPNGKSLWRTALPASTSEVQTAFDPAIGSTVGYWPEDGIVHALRLKDGKQLWQVVQGVSLDGVWLNHNVLTVLTDDFGGGGLLEAYNATSGKPLWRLAIPGKGLTIGGPVATGDGGLAWVRADGRLQVVDLTTGKVRWTQTEGTKAQIAAQFPQLAVAGTRVYYLAGGRFSAYDDHTGHIAWSEHGVPVHTTLSVGAGELLLDGGWKGAAYALGAVDPAHGGIRWQFPSTVQLTVLASGSGVVAVAPQSAGATPAETFVDAHSGATRWQVPSPIFGTPVVIRAADTLAVEGNGDYDKPALLVDRRLSDGSVIWQLPVHHQAALAVSLTVFGHDVVINPDGEFAHPYTPLYAFDLTTGKAAWTVGTLRPLQAAPVVTAKATYVTAADDADLC